MRERTRTRHVPPPLRRIVCHARARPPRASACFRRYIFTRVYSARGHDHEVAALKAVAKHTAAKQGALDKGSELGTKSGTRTGADLRPVVLGA